MSGTALEAHEITKTYDCKTPGCENESRSRVGRYSYCDDCREHRARTAKAGVGLAGPAPLPHSLNERAQAAQPSAKVTSFEAAAKQLVKAGKAVDTHRAKAASKTQAALDAKRVADQALAEFRRQVRGLLGEDA